MPYAGLIRQPKYGHLKELHKAIKLCEHALVSSDPTVTSLGAYQQVSHLAFSIPVSILFWWYNYLNLQTIFPCDAELNLVIFQAHIFYTGQGKCAAFLSNFHSTSAARVTFNGRHYNLPPWSISILPDCKNVVFNTAKVSKVPAGNLF